MKNKLMDLNNHLFAQLERLSEEGLSEKDLKEEIRRAGAITGIARELIAVGQLALDAEQMSQKGGSLIGLPMLERNQ